MMTSPTPTIRPFDGSAIPATLKAQKRWAPWRAVLNEKKQKFDKIPHRADRPEFGISTAKPDQWFSYDVALASYLANPKMFAGVGYVMTGPHGIIGTDLDNCIIDGAIAPWAQEVITQLDSYTEISPSGKGLRILSMGDAPNDWNNHEVGIEVYGGNEARFLTVTGSHLPGTQLDLAHNDSGVLKALETRYAKERRKADVIDLNMPEILDDLLLPELSGLDLPYAVKDFLTEGLHSGDRSRAVFSSAVALYAADLADDEVFSILANNPYVMEIALDHRRQDGDRALLYVWREHCCKGKARSAELRSLSSSDFDVLPQEPKTFDLAPVDNHRFRVQSAQEFSKRKPVQWIIKGILPRAELCVLFGDSGSGKSFFALDMVGAVALGTPWRGKKVAQGRTVYVCAEGAGGFRNRVQAYAEHQGLDISALPIGVIPDAPNLMEKADIKDLITSIRLFGKTDIIVIDTFAQSFQGNENSGEDVGRALAHCKALHRATGAMVILVAHSGKDASRGTRGWSGLRAAADAQIEVVRSGDDRAAIIDKQKDGAGEGDEYGFRLNIVTIGTDEDGDDITSCVLNETAGVPRSERKQEIKGANQKLVLKVLKEMREFGSEDVDANALLEAVVNQMVFDPSNGKRDRRREVVHQSIANLQALNHVSLNHGSVKIS